MRRLSWLLAVLLMRAFDSSGMRRGGVWVVVFAAALTAAYGALDEWHQAFTGRVPDGWDVLANIAGLLCGVVLAGLVGGRRRKHGG